MKKISYLIAFISIVLFGNFRCGKEIEIIPKFEFEVKVKLLNEQKKYKLGDTIWLETETLGNVLFDKKTKTDQEIPKAHLKYHVEVGGRWDNAPFDGNPHFGFVVDTFLQSVQNANDGHFTSMSRIDFLYGCRDFNDRYKIKVGVLLKTKGIFRLLFDEQADINVNLKLNPDCSESSISSNPNEERGKVNYVLDITDKNIDVWKKSLPLPADFSSTQKDIEESRINKKVNFWFEVE